MNGITINVFICRRAHLQRLQFSIYGQKSPLLILFTIIEIKSALLDNSSNFEFARNMTYLFYQHCTFLGQQETEKLQERDTAVPADKFIRHQVMIT